MPRSIWFLLLPALLSSCQPSELPMSGQTMGTTWELTVHDKVRQDSLAFVPARLEELEGLFTNWQPGSAVERFNRTRSTDWQPVPTELAEVVRFALEISGATDGAFDVTLAPLVELWGFGAQGPITAPPSDEAITAAAEHTGWQKLQARLEPPALRKTDADLRINVSALVEGYAVDDLVRRLRERGHHHFLLNIGGEIYASGQRPDGKPWQVGLQHPGAAIGVTMTSLPLTDQALATSGMYRQYFVHEGRSYPHVLDGRTGRPVTHEGAFVSVVDPSCLRADAWATALAVLPPTEARELAEKIKLSTIIVERK